MKKIISSTRHDTDVDQAIERLFDAYRRDLNSVERVDGAKPLGASHAIALKQLTQARTDKASGKLWDTLLDTLWEEVCTHLRSRSPTLPDSYLNAAVDMFAAMSTAV
jgi:hypothetical protein